MFFGKHAVWHVMQRVAKFSLLVESPSSASSTEDRDERKVLAGLPIDDQKISTTPCTVVDQLVDCDGQFNGTLGLLMSRGDGTSDTDRADHLGGDHHPNLRSSPCDAIALPPTMICESSVSTMICQLCATHFGQAQLSGAQ